MRRVTNNIKNHSNWLSYYTYKYLQSGENSLTFKGRTGVNVEVPKRLMHTYKECFFDETYLRGFPKEQVDAPIKSIVDIGANVGYFSLFMLSRYPGSKVFAFEPIPKNYKKLEAYRQQNSQLNFHGFNKAVAQPGVDSITLHFDDTDDFTTSATLFENTDQGHSLEVGCLSLEEVLNENDLNHLDFLKVDCEGAEYAILYNTPIEVYERIKRISIETHPGEKEGENRDALVDFIQSKGYTVNVEGDIVWAWR